MFLGLPCLWTKLHSGNSVLLWLYFVPVCFLASNLCLYCCWSVDFMYVLPLCGNSCHATQSDDWSAGLSLTKWHFKKKIFSKGEFNILSINLHVLLLFPVIFCVGIYCCTWNWSFLDQMLPVHLRRRVFWFYFVDTQPCDTEDLYLVQYFMSLCFTAPFSL